MFLHGQDPSRQSAMRTIRQQIGRFPELAGYSSTRGIRPEFPTGYLHSEERSVTALIVMMQSAFHRPCDRLQIPSPALTHPRVRGTHGTSFILGTASLPRSLVD